MSSAKNKQEMTNPMMLDPYPHFVNKEIRSLIYNEKKSGDRIPPCFCKRECKEYFKTTFDREDHMVAGVQ